MSELNYFQMYSQSENHITNNVMLMLRHLYRVNPNKLQTVLSNWHEGGLMVGPEFFQQRRDGNSIPDAGIKQTAFELTVEVKPHKGWNSNQLENHAQGIHERAENSQNILLLLSTDERPNLEVISKKYPNIIIASETFEGLLSILDDERVIAPHELELAEIRDDLRSFFVERDLLPNPYLMFAFLCNQTFEWNIKHKIYYEPQSRPSKASVLTGFYSKKAIRGIGRPHATVVGILNEADNTKVEYNKHDIPEEELIARVKLALKDTPVHEGLEFSETRYYLYDDTDFVETNFEKVTSGGYQYGTWLNLATVLGRTEIKDIQALSDTLIALSKEEKREFWSSRGW